MSALPSIQLPLTAAALIRCTDWLGLSHLSWVGFWRFRCLELMMLCFLCAMFCFVRVIIEEYGIDKKPSRKSKKTDSKPDNAPSGNLSKLSVQSPKPSASCHHLVARVNAYGRLVTLNLLAKRRNLNLKSFGFAKKHKHGNDT